MLIAVLSDIHSNLAALRAVLADLDAAGAATVWCLGDLVGYGPEPNACVDLVRARAALCLGGNHDLAALGEMDLDYFNADAAFAAIWTGAALSETARKFLGRLPNLVVQDAFTLAHGSPREPVWEYVLSPGVARNSFRYFETDYCLVGHTHWPVVWRQDGADTEVECLALPADEPFPLGKERLILNPGSVGQPRDGDPRASYLLIDTAARTATLRRVVYPIEETQAGMRAANLPVRLIERLTVGR